MREQRPFKLQWHITDHCNLRCKHCYQENSINYETNINDCKILLDQFDELIEKIEDAEQVELKAHISITGGEPMLNGNFVNILKAIKDKKKYRYSVLSNGSFIDEESLSFFKTYPPLFIQLSMEGKRETHDDIRGKGDFDRTCHVANRLVKAGIKTILSFTAHKGNYKEFESVADIARELKVYKVWTDRLIPYGDGKQLTSMSIDETKDYIRLIKKVKNDKKYGRSRTLVSADRALQFLSGGHHYSCSAGRHLLTVMPDGTVYPCRRMPVNIGNIKEKTLTQIYEDNAFVDKLQKTTTIKGCEKCKFSEVCRGGLKCLSFAIHNDAFIKDVGCWFNG